jgi:hypothetical protein
MNPSACWVQSWHDGMMPRIPTYLPHCAWRPPRTRDKGQSAAFALPAALQRPRGPSETLRHSRPPWRVRGGPVPSSVPGHCCRPCDNRECSYPKRCRPTQRPCWRLWRRRAKRAIGCCYCCCVGCYCCCVGCYCYCAAGEYPSCCAGASCGRSLDGGAGEDLPLVRQSLPSAPRQSPPHPWARHRRAGAAKRVPRGVLLRRRVPAVRPWEDSAVTGAAAGADAWRGSFLLLLRLLLAACCRRGSELARQSIEGVRAQREAMTDPLS